MKDFLISNKVFISVVLGTLILIFGGVFLMSQSGTGSAATTVSDSILNPSDAQRTGGLKDGKYLPASSSALLTFVEFGDYECPACGAYSPLVQKLMVDFAGKVNFVFRNFPLSQHANANISSYAAEAAGLQGKFWEMHTKLYDTQSAWSTSTDAKSIFISYAKDLGLNVDQFQKDIDSQKVKDRVQKDLTDGNLAKINSTPTFFLNGKIIQNPGNYDDFKTLVNDALTKNPVNQTPAPEAYHIHFDLKVYLNGAAINLSLPKYQSTEGKELNPYIHVHDGNGKVVHVHKEGVALKEFFDSIKVTIRNGTIAYVNGKKTEDILNYIPQDLDQILIGNSNLKLVSNDACIYSLKCPERGTPPTENCVGGLGTGCKEQ